MDSYLILYGAVSVLLVALNLLNTLKTNGAVQAQQRKNLLVLTSRVSFVLLCRGAAYRCPERLWMLSMQFIFLSLLSELGLFFTSEFIRYRQGPRDAAETERIRRTLFRQLRGGAVALLICGSVLTWMIQRWG